MSDYTRSTVLLIFTCYDKYKSSYKVITGEEKKVKDDKNVYWQ